MAGEQQTTFCINDMVYVTSSPCRQLEGTDSSAPLSAGWHLQRAATFFRLSAGL
jgi:hypothetical protein